MTQTAAAAIADWRARRSFTAADFPLARLLEAKRETVSVILPTRDVAATVGPIAATLAELVEAGLIDELVAIDSASTDGTADLAAAAGARVVQEDAVLASFGACLGKGDAMWRALSLTTGDLVVFLDADTEDFDAGFVLGLLGPLICHGLAGEVDFVKGAFLRPLRRGEEFLPGEGGRVSELVARPLLNLHAPALSVFDQPLAGEVAGRRSLLERLPFPAGYGVEIAMLIDAWRAVGVDRLAQVDLGTRQNHHQPLRALSAMAYAVVAAATARFQPLPGGEAAGLLALPPIEPGGPMEVRSVTVVERPPLSELDARRPLR